jgi:hypothetical protein
MCPVCFSSVTWLITGGVSVISESNGIPPRLSLPGRSIPASVFVHDHDALGHIENATKSQTSDEGEKGNDDTGNALRCGRIRIKRSDISA